jgi:hypothetical protein
MNNFEPLQKKMRDMLPMLLLIGALLAFLAFTSLTQSLSPDGLAKEAHSLVATCSKESGRDHQRCYEDEVPKLVKDQSLAEIFEIIRLIRHEDTSYQFCHELAHRLGEQAVAEDPDAWLNLIPENPDDGLCSNGFVHGIIAGRFRTDVLDDKTLKGLIPDFARACEARDNWTPTDLDRNICYHGMGHLFVMITTANLPRALEICSETTTKHPEFERLCVEGVFMQIYQPLEPEDYALIEELPVKLSRDTVPAYCASFKNPEYVGACLRESLALSWEKIFDGLWVSQFCAVQPNKEESKRCFESAFSLLGRMSLAKPEQALKTCRESSEDQKDMCYSYAARTILEEDRTAADRAANFCAEVPEGNRTACYDFLSYTARSILGTRTDRIQKLCNAMPETSKTTCERMTSGRGQETP